ncbi:hypothetical protein CANARDRAFT_29029 [[Candida] arabinofermentans NRRL YB-2248]|uniref:glucan endo-1,3-beta-D-glucosidase n=1 Tax=[Candida] arabinofermentans NRRL YB-2248 TaxID=983967 RepID=A0A1E4SYB4_9ASCO|nr:hypothetical protein CANARDRAFT_29029 [[Candida] arabinofermentans NRRL YB-2248]
MQFSKTTLLSIVTILTSTANAACSLVDGNYYCSETTAIVYEGIGYSGSYSDVTAMDESTCECTQESVSFSGTMSPLDEELSVHFRGPLKLLQFGVYYPSSSSSSKKVKREAEEDCTTTRHIHHQHKRAPAVEIVEVTATVYVDDSGNTMTTYDTATSTTGTGDLSTTLSTKTTSSATSSDDSESSSSSSSSSVDETTSSTKSSTESLTESSTESSASSTSSSSSSSDDSTSGWSRKSYFTPGSTDNCTFLNTLGDSSKSGTWSSCFGNSISYCDSDGTSVASSATALDEVTIDSDVEYMIFSGSECGDDDGCGYYREDIPAYHGFSGKTKMFVFEFEMPTATDDATTNYDMPAIWLLNAKIPRTLQYGDSSCSCWSTGCGELDLFEILSSGSSKLISHIHDGQGDNGSSSGGGGSQDYFARPTDSSMKAAAIFNDGEIHIVVLDDDVSFDSDLDSDTVSEWLSASGSTASLS